MNVRWIRPRLPWLLAGLIAAVGLATVAIWSLAGLSVQRDGPEAADHTGLWTGTSGITMSRETTDFSLGYTMQCDFWFRLDAAGKVQGRAYAVYQPTFDAAGLNNKIQLAKSAVGGALVLLPGGELAFARSAIELGKGATNLAISGLVGVEGTFDDPRPVRSGEITGSLIHDKLTLRWVDEQSQTAGIPAEISLRYVNRKELLARPTLKVEEPWQIAAKVDADSGGLFAIAQKRTESKPEDNPKESLFVYWTASRVQ